MAVVYADGGTEHVTVDVTDWRANTPAAGSESAVTLPYFNASKDNCPVAARDGSSCREPVSLYVAPVPVDAGREVAGVILPRLSPSPEGPVATMHVFAIAVDG